MASEFISVFDMFKIGIGPSSSHTLGPWRAAQRFTAALAGRNLLEKTTRIQCDLFGSLAKTGRGHGTDLAVMLGLACEDPVHMDVAKIPIFVEAIQTSGALNVGSVHVIPYSREGDIRFHYKESLPFHPNALRFTAFGGASMLSSEIYYSVGGGFIIQDSAPAISKSLTGSKPEAPFDIETAQKLLFCCQMSGMTIAEIVLENENAFRAEAETRSGILEIWKIMQECVYRGSHTPGELPGGLKVARRAASLNEKLLGGQLGTNQAEWHGLIKLQPKNFKNIVDWVSCFALAVNEENASFGRVVTAPTNGAAGVIPAVLHYLMFFCENQNEEDVIHFLLTASEIGSIFKKGSTISAAMGGCQAEIGVSSAMAAAGLTACQGGTQRQVLMAAEIAMEHHLGLTCDPIGGLVQIPCIERNTMGAIKAITASQLALQSNPDNARVSLDNVVNTMWATAQDMNVKYKETADGGLAVQIPLGLSEC